MGSFSPEWYQAHLAKEMAKLGKATETFAQGVSREIEELHYPIMKWCKEQHPIVPYIRARSDKASGIAEGCQDFTIFYKGKAWCFECKRAGGKLSPEQVAWKLLMELQGFEVHVIRSLEEFLSIIAK